LTRLRGLVRVRLAGYGQPHDGRGRRKLSRTTTSRQVTSVTSIFPAIEFAILSIDVMNPVHARPHAVSIRTGVC